MSHPYECPACGHAIRATEEYADGGRQVWYCPDDGCRILTLTPGDGEQGAGE